MSSLYNDPVIEKIIVARVGLLLRHPFFGNLSTRMKLIDASDWLPTAATDFRNLYYNREFFDKMSVKQIEFVVAHEILHCVFEHMMRREGRDPQRWNIAADYCVNGLLKKEGIGNDPPVKFFYDKKYDGWSAEQVYDYIEQEYDDMQLQALGQLLDQHLDGDGDGDGNSEGNGNRPQYSKEELRKLRDEIREAMIQAANAAGAGNVPGDIQRLIKEFTEPQMNWRELLQQQIQSLIKTDFSFTRPNRKALHSGAILPGSNFEDTIDVCVAIDMSGSITDKQAAIFLGEIKGIMQSYRDFKIKVWTFDTKVYGEQDFDGYTADEIDNYECKGGGGTDFMANWDYMIENDIVPKKLILFTDLYPCGSFGIEDYCDTIFVGHGTTSIVAPFGTTVYFTE